MSSNNLEAKIHSLDGEQRSLLMEAAIQSKHYGKNIRQCKNYYELKLNCEKEVQGLRKRSEELEKSIRKEKNIYKLAMDKLENISSEVKGNVQ